MKRQPNWGQENPRDQARVILGAIEGDLSNMIEGIGDSKIQLQRMHTFLYQVEELVRDLPEGKWDK